MEKFSKFLSIIKFKTVLTILLASSLVVISTACSQGNIAAVGEKAISDTAQKVMTDSYDDYDAEQSFRGGMNGYNDDRRYDAETAAKAKALIDSAKSRQKDSWGEYADSITDRAGNKIEEAKNTIPRTIQANKEEAIDYIDDKSDLVKDNLSKVPGGAKKVFDGAVDTAQDAIEDAKNATKNTAKEVKGNFQDLT
ncbi:hypothetical protein I4641_21235 [Waterburya agarophytonicola K14]|uniref:Late embryogenesis abundant protein n=1 Tax=Waterburya agarophytonicola KI4 TaxID=2874699 RepID=A0A964FI03_9CYAN|nr:hypothetical protein [Waterburya agarophytonicola]MCC0179487.1 hypothetical protein [Waterburya agarophytonicola KI4]